MNDEITDLLDRHNWSESILKLTAYALSLCRLNHITLPPRLEPEDLVMEAIEKVYTGERTWNHHEEPDLHRFLLSVVKSILYNKISSQDNKTGVKMNEGIIDSIPSYEDTESEMYAKQLDTAINAAMQGDPELCLVYKAVKDGYKPQEIAADYAIDISVIRNAKKRLSRMVYSVIAQLTKPNHR